MPDTNLKKSIDLVRLQQFADLVANKFVQPTNITVGNNANPETEQPATQATITFAGTTGKGTAGTAATKTLTFASTGGTFTTSGNTITFNPDAADVYTITQAATAETGYIATYNLMKNGTAVGDSINIPKDFLVKSASVETVKTADTPYAGAVVGDKYIDFVVNTVGDDETAQHIYLPVNDLVDVYTGGNGIDVSNANVVSVKIDTAKALAFDASGNIGVQVTAGNGLSIDNTTNAITMALATDDAAGAMSAEDKAKLDALDDDYATQLTAEANATSGADLKLGNTNGPLSTVNVSSANKGADVGVTSGNITLTVNVNADKAVAIDTTGIGVVADTAKGITVSSTGVGMNVDETNTFVFTNGVLGIQYASDVEIANLF